MPKTPIDLLLLLIDVSVKSLLLAGIVFVLLRVLKVRSSSVRHRVWATVLCGMLVMPVLSRIVPALPLPFSIDAAWLNALDEHVPVEPNSEPTAPAEAVEIPNGISEPQSLASNFAESSQNMVPGLRFDQQPNSMVSAADSETREPVSEEVSVTAATEIAQKETRPALEIPWLLWILRWLPILIMGVWLTGAAVMLPRLMVGLLVTRGIVRRSTDISRHLSEVPALKTGRRGTVLESPEIRVPVTVGLLSPAILLPEEWRDWSERKLEAVLTHEKTHIDRHDFLFAVVAELNRCLYWFHPVSWWLRTQLSDLAEEACDDAAIDLTGDPAGYARHLLEVATSLSRSQGRVCQPGLSMARQSNVEGRITTILDLTRPLSERLTWKTTSLIVAVMFPVIAAAAALRPSPSDTAASVEPVAAVELVSAKNGGETAESAASQDGKAIAADEYTLFGRVIDPQGKPVAGARLFFGTGEAQEPFTVTDESGTFRSRHRTTELKDKAHVPVVAVAPDHQFGFGHKMAFHFEPTGRLKKSANDWVRRLIEREVQTTDNVIHLTADDVPVQGRVVTAEGQPVKGAIIDVLNVMDGLGGNLDDFRKAAAAPDADFSLVTKHLRQVSGSIAAKIVQAEVSNENGEFTIRGIGRDRIVKIGIRGPHIAAGRLQFITHDADTIRTVDQTLDSAAADSTMVGNGITVYEPSSFTYVGATSQSVVGRICSRDTNEPIPGCIIRATKFGDSEREGLAVAGFVNTTTDTNGNYRLDGLPLGVNHFTVVPPVGTDFIRIENQVRTVASPDPFEQNILLVTGIRIKGRVTDSKGQPVAGKVGIHPYRENPLFQGKDKIGLSYWDAAVFPTDTNGHFEAVVVPGKGALCFFADEHDLYLRGIGAETLTGQKVDFAPAIDACPRYFFPVDYHAVAEYNVSRGDTAKHMEIVVTSGTSTTIRVVDSAGQPVDGFQVNGRRSADTEWETVDGTEVEIVRLEPGEVRRVAVWHAASNAVGTIICRAPESGTLKLPDQQIQMQRGGIIRGRVIDKDNKPLAGLRLVSRFRSRSSDASEPDVTKMAHFPGTQGYTRSADPADIGKLVTDDDGRFELVGILPELQYSAQVVGANFEGVAFTAMGESDGPMIRYGMAPVFNAETIQSGEVKDLGDISVGGPEPVRLKRNAAVEEPVTAKVDAPASTTTASHSDVPAATDESTVELSGRVIDPDGKPVVGAELLLVRWDMETKSLAVTKADGTFQVKADREACKSYASVIAVADGYGFASRPAVVLEEAGTLMAELPDRQQKVIMMILGEGRDLKLKRDDVPLRGQILNPEGQIVRGARVTITEIWESKDGSLDEWEQATKAPRADYYSVREKASIRLDSRCSDLITRVEVADDGSFMVHGIGPDRIVRIALTAPGVAGAQVYARTRAGETIKLPNEWQDRSRFDTYYANEFRYVAGASQTLEGRVTDRDTGEPVAGVRLVANNPAGSNLQSMQAAGFINATTDNDGRYRLEGLPVGNNGFLVLPTLESGYVRVAARVTTAASTESLVKDIRIPRGVRLTGRVIDSNTGKGLLGYYEYCAFLTHPDLTGENRVRLASVDMQHNRTDKDGRFAMNVLPGRGLIGFMADNAGDYPRGAGADRIIDGDSTNEGGMKLFQTAPHRLISDNYNVLAEFQGDVNDPPKLELQLQSGMSFTVKVVDSKGAELKDYLFFGSEKPSGWYPPIVNDGKVVGHQKTDTRRLFAWNPQTNEAGTLLITGDPPENPVIRLQPASTITGRLVDDDGEPVAGAAIHSSADVNGFFDEKTQATDLGSFPDDQDTRRDSLVTDNDGRFTIRGVLPGLKYSASANKASDGNSEVYLGDLFKDVVIEGAETKNLGDVKAQHDHPTLGTDTGR